MLRIERLREHLKQSLWFVPSLLLLGFVAFAVAAAYVDQNVLAAREDLSLYGGSAEGAHTIFATIATAMLSLAVLVFSITLIVLQLASTQLTPRVLPLFLQNRWSKIAMGVFLGTFAYALVGLWVVRIPSNGDGGLVPVLTVSLAFVAVALSLVTFLNYIHRVAQSIRLETISTAIAPAFAMRRPDAASALAMTKPETAVRRDIATSRSCSARWTAGCSTASAPPGSTATR